MHRSVDEFQSARSFTHDDESRHPLSEPAQWGVAYSHRQYRMRGLSDRATAFTARRRGAGERAAGERAADVRCERFDSWLD